MKRGSPTGGIRFIVMFFLVCGLAVLGIFGKSSFELLFQDVRQVAGYHAICRRVLSSRCLLRCGASEPVREMRRAEARRLIVRDHERIRPTDLGQRFLNDLLQLFLPDAKRA